MHLCFCPASIVVQTKKIIGLERATPQSGTEALVCTKEPAHHESRVQVQPE